MSKIMLKKPIICVLGTMTSLAMAMDGDLNQDQVLSEQSGVLQPVLDEINTIQHTFICLSPAEGSTVEFEKLAPCQQPIPEFLECILGSSKPGTYIDTSGQQWNVSNYDEFVLFVDDRRNYALSSDFVRPDGVYCYQGTGMISVIYDFIKDSDQFFTLELTQIAAEYRAAREQEAREYRALRDIQDRELEEA